MTMIQAKQVEATKIGDNCTAAGRPLQCRAVYETKEGIRILRQLDLKDGEVAPTNDSKATIPFETQNMWSLSFKNIRGIGIALIIYGVAGAPCHGERNPAGGLDRRRRIVAVYGVREPVRTKHAAADARRRRRTRPG